ncbi:AAA family ATPase [Pedobacter sp. PWIIR3]
MTKNIFIASAEPYTGKSVIAFGMINMLLAKTQKVGYFKPIIAQEDPSKKDEHVEAMLDFFSLPISYEDAFAFTRQQMLHQSDNENTSDLLNTIISKYKKLEDNYDFTVIEGSDFLGEDRL